MASEIDNEKMMNVDFEESYDTSSKQPSDKPEDKPSSHMPHVPLKVEKKSQFCSKTVSANEIASEIDYEKMVNVDFNDSSDRPSKQPSDKPSSDTSYVSVKVEKEFQIPFISNSSNERRRNRRDPVFFGDFDESDMDCRVKRTRFWKVAHETVDKHKKLTKYYQCQLRRQKNKIESLKELLNELKKKEKCPKPLPK
ncbi:unnamed protein product [Ceutorhynchus assimilis]|uniref:Uncharacterized protein n=1 Tax=Ceutorhynchus assimilis TaxID=467358 RepID=A0A9P0DYK2_9CUCU|nr:unnamed protein product [Ceutorhynchus assimilis]